ncbi:predicted protein [Histoplasma capsulatum H143]|uniref:Uncharacterized protein n=1 Tax=Ajellomyces capsulatus (strain H143) TaxID=544712 RepID=C6H3Q7_AJECH|nr:predicted protein [Histoplasma capsulatum H143]
MHGGMKRGPGCRVAVGSKTMRTTDSQLHSRMPIAMAIDGLLCPRCLGYIYVQPPLDRQAASSPSCPWSQAAALATRQDQQDIGNDGDGDGDARCAMRLDAGCGWRPRCFSSAELCGDAQILHRASTDDAKHTRSKRGDMENRTEDPTRRWRKRKTQEMK